VNILKPLFEFKNISVDTLTAHQSVLTLLYHVLISTMPSAITKEFTIFNLQSNHTSIQRIVLFLTITVINFIL